VVGSGGSGRLVIGGYSGGDGIETKRFLLDHEARIAGHPFGWTGRSVSAAQSEAGL
jgi:hypothetical protein